MRNLYLTFYLCVFVFSALMEVVNLSVSVTKTSVTIMWEWQRKSEPVRVSRYEAVLRKDSDKQCMWVNEPFNIKSHSTVKKKKVCLFFIRFVHVYFLTCRGVTQNCYAYFITFLQMQHSLPFAALPLWPDDQQHTFYDLMPNAQYSVTLLADNVSKSIVQMTTDFGEFHWTQNQIPFCGFFALQRWLHFFVVDFYSIYLESIIEAISAAPPGVWTAAFVHL